MFISLEAGADAGAVQRQLTGFGLWTRKLITRVDDADLVSFEVGGHSAPVSQERVEAIDGVANVYVAGNSHPLVDEQSGQVVDLGLGVTIGPGYGPVLFAGPCSAESRDQVAAAAMAAARAGARVLRGGAYKPRTSPYSFDGHGLVALEWLRDAAFEQGLLLCTEVMSPDDVALVAAFADILQIGSRNMQNFTLLKAAGKAGLPVLLKRSMSSSVDEWLLAGEHLLAAGAAAVVFCERGILGFDRHTRNLLDLGAVAVLKHVYGQPVIVDPSHAVGRRDLIHPMARAALAAGADGLMVETHPDAGRALSDGAQALDSAALIALGDELLQSQPRITRDAA
jgi:3-deoxy-7-phosphoheptulonate synthase